MKVKSFKSVFAITIAMIAGIDVFYAQKADALSDIAMENVEALADNEWMNVQKESWQKLDYEYYTLEVPAGWVFLFGGEDKASIHKRNIKVKNEKGERVEYELGTLVWQTEQKNPYDFDRVISVEIRSFRKTSSEAAFLDEVGGKVPEASWPDYLKIVTKKNGGDKGNRWKQFLLKGESQGFSATTGSFTRLIWEYKYFVEKNGMVYCVTVTMPDEVRSSSPEYNKLAHRIIKSFKVK